MSDQDSSSKRQRINQACDQCRKRKSKCDGGQPSCSTCDNLGKVCTYGTPVKKRGLPTGYVRGVEALLGLFQQFLPNGEYTLRKVLRDNIAGRVVDSEYLDNASDIWRSSDLAKDFEQLFSSVDSNIATRLTTDAPQLPQLRNLRPPHQQPDSVNLFEKLQQCAELPSPDYPPNIQEIIDLYFQTTHCWFPILERRTILKALYHDEAGNESEHDSKNYGLCLWAIVAYTSATLTGKSNLLGSIHPDSIQTYVRFCLTKNENSFSIGSVQALCILALLNIGQRQFNTSRFLLLQAFTMLIDANAVDRQNSERYYHTLHGCFFLDQLLSAYLSTTSFFPNTWYSVIGHLDENALEEWELSLQPKSYESPFVGYDRQPLRTISSFNLTCELVSKIPPLDEDKLDRDQLHGLITHLQTWHSNLKKHHQLPRVGIAIPPVLILHLTYSFVLLLVLEQAIKAGIQHSDLIEKEASATLDLLAQSLESGHPLYRNPLLVIYASQMKSAIDLSRNFAPSDINTNFRSRFSQFFANFQEVYNFNRPSTSSQNPIMVSRPKNGTMSLQALSTSPLVSTGGTTVPEDRIYVSEQLYLYNLHCLACTIYIF
jgi:Fungal Zn(2)-Cys(6) binuclear cluster domain